MTAISVLMPSRGRPSSLRESAWGLLDSAGDRGAVEVLVALDPDDETAATAAWLMEATPQVKTWTAPERYGYPGLHLYWNRLAEMAAGDWLMLWNDDARMLTPGWDAIVRQCPPAVLWPEANHAPHACQFAIWPRAWTVATGHIALSPHVDTWMQGIGERLGRMLKIPVQVLHDRADVTGGHEDQTYAEGRALLGPEGMADNFGAHYAAIDAEALLIAGLLTGAAAAQ